MFSGVGAGLLGGWAGGGWWVGEKEEDTGA